MSGNKMFVEAGSACVPPKRADLHSETRPADEKLAALFIYGVPFLIILFGAYSGGLNVLLRDLLFFFGGQPEPAAARKLFSFSTTQAIFLLASLDLLVSMITLKCVRLLVDKPDASNNLETSFLRMIKDGNLYSSLLVLAAIEEILFRWFFLSVILSILPTKGAIETYSLIMISSLLFAVMHYLNYQSQDRRWTRVVHHFFVGCLYSFAFLTFGLAAAIFVHFTGNVVVFTAQRIVYRV